MKTHSIGARLVLLAVAGGVALSAACGSDEESGRPNAPVGGSGASSDGGTSSTGGGGTAPGVESGCGSVRMTQYSATDQRWCGFDRSDAILPEFVRQGMTVAIAEPYATSSYEGEVGEACGECWEIDTTFATQIVMVHDLCPVEGNPICAGSHFHFDVSNEVAAVLDGGGWLGEGSVRRVPCPVTGNIHAFVSDRNEYGYLKLAFFNHRFPIRTAEYRAVGSEQWLPMSRCLARWCVEDDMSTFADDGPGAVFRLTNALGEAVEGTAVLTYATAADSTFDVGAQFAPAEPAGEACEFVPPGDVYDERWGGIDGVRWEPNTWGGTSLTEIGTGCAESSASCLLLGSFQDSGMHVTYRHVFPTSTFSHLSLQLRAQSGGGEVQIAPRTAEARCEGSTYVDVGSEWVPVAIDVAASCAAATEIQGLTISSTGSAIDLVVDEIRFE